MDSEIIIGIVFATLFIGTAWLEIHSRRKKSKAVQRTNSAVRTATDLGKGELR